MAVQHRLGILSKRRFGSYFANRVTCRFAALEWNALSSTRWPTSSGVAAFDPYVLGILNFAPSAIHVPSVRAGLAFSGEADPPLSARITPCGATVSAYG